MKGVYEVRRIIPLRFTARRRIEAGSRQASASKSEEGGDAEWSLTYTGEFREDMNSHLVMGAHSVRILTRICASRRSLAVRDADVEPARA